VVNIVSNFEIRIIEQETDNDHIHILFASKPSVTLSKFINILKSVTSRMIRKEGLGHNIGHSVGWVERSETQQLIYQNFGWHKI
jgi:REP element-mobilizing transposase RayT